MYFLESANLGTCLALPLELRHSTCGTPKQKGYMAVIAIKNKQKLSGQRLQN